MPPRKGIQVVVHNPFWNDEPQRKPWPPQSSEDWECLVSWLECVFGSGNVIRISYTAKYDNIVLEVNRSIDVGRMLGCHRWSDFMVWFRKGESDQASLMFKFDAKYNTGKLGYSDYYPSTTPRTHPRVKHPYPLPTYALPPVSRSRDEIPISLPMRDLSNAVPEVKSEIADGPVVARTHTNSTNAQTGAQVMIKAEPSDVKRKEASSLEPRSGPTSSPKVKMETSESNVVVKSESETKPLIPKAENDAPEQPIVFLIIQNPIGFNVDDYSDLSGVVAWLEHPELFGPNSVNAIWARLFDIRLIVSVACIPSMQFRVIGTHTWRDCVAQCPPGREDERTDVALLAKRLRDPQALQSEGWLWFEPRRPSSRVLQLVQPYPDSHKDSALSKDPDLGTTFAETFERVEAFVGQVYIKEEIPRDIPSNEIEEKPQISTRLDKPLVRPREESLANERDELGMFSGSVPNLSSHADRPRPIPSDEAYQTRTHELILVPLILF
ncbi:hypothetical protein SISSUDRAFT_1049152 [Sistotremastrum suecicum HHB10207 ss-3]|uniref:Uncharacterized protein n=1 Tax=Sistotremastrum suecicum HHB10207 ss-3 TaxID=1314776 RepID=A0A166C0D1_9AGAM|nr:hypothetical protein SISSUDRAFT_1049152 [Sistotremastrum suecicum HHB10207 ss-3]